MSKLGNLIFVWRKIKSCFVESRVELTEWLLGRGGEKKLYRVQIGAYSMKKNADKQLEKAKKAGFKDAFVKYE